MSLTPGMPAAAPQPAGVPTPTVATPLPTPNVAATPQTGITTTAGLSAGPAQGSRMPVDLRKLRAAAPIACVLTGLAASGLVGLDGLQQSPYAVIDQHRYVSEALHTFRDADLLAGSYLALQAIDSSAPSPERTERLNRWRGRYTARSQEVGPYVVQAAGAAGALPELPSAVNAMTSYATSMERTLTPPAGSATSPARSPVEAASASYRRLGADAQTRILTPLQTVSAAGLTRLGSDDAVGGRAGGRALVILVGGLSTVALVLTSAWLARKTHRIVNPGLALATLLTLGVTAMATVPGISFGDSPEVSVRQATRVGQLSEQLYQLRRTELSSVLPGGDPAAAQREWQERSGQITGNARTMGSEFTAAWRAYTTQHAPLVDTRSPVTERVAALTASTEAFSNVLSVTRTAQAVAARGLTNSVGDPAYLESGTALVAGLVAAGAAWVGIGRRLREYR